MVTERRVRPVAGSLAAVPLVLVAIASASRLAVPAQAGGLAPVIAAQPGDAASSLSVLHQQLAQVRLRVRATLAALQQPGGDHRAIAQRDYPVLLESARAAALRARSLPIAPQDRRDIDQIEEMIRRLADAASEIEETRRTMALVVDALERVMAHLELGSSPPGPRPSSATTDPLLVARLAREVALVHAGAAAAHAAAEADPVAARSVVSGLLASLAVRQQTAAASLAALKQGRRAGAELALQTKADALEREMTAIERERSDAAARFRAGLDAAQAGATTGLMSRAAAASAAMAELAAAAGIERVACPALQTEVRNAFRAMREQLTAEFARLLQAAAADLAARRRVEAQRDAALSALAAQEALAVAGACR